MATNKGCYVQAGKFFFFSNNFFKRFFGKKRNENKPAIASLESKLVI